MFFCLMIIFVFILVVVFLAHYNIWRPRRSADLPRVLMYHSIEPGVPTGMNTPPDKFEKQLQYLLKSGYNPVTISELLRGGASRPVAITLDDGFANNYEYLFPLLKKYKCKATIYLAPQIEGIRALSSAQIDEMNASGLVEFGAHTLQHVNLTTLDEEDARDEISRSREAVEALTGGDCQSFSYPFGRYAEEHIQMVADAGFTSAVTTKKRIEKILKPYQISRLSINGKANLFQYYITLTRGRYRV